VQARMGCTSSGLNFPGEQGMVRKNSGMHLVPREKVSDASIAAWHAAWYRMNGVAVVVHV